MDSKQDYILRAIGLSTVAMSELQDAVTEAIRLMISNDYELSLCITARMLFLERLTLLSTLFRYRVSDEVRREKFRQLAVTMEGLNAERNRIIHDQSFIFDDVAYRKSIDKNIKKGLVQKTSQFTVKDILGFVEHVHDARFNLQVLIEENELDIVAHRVKNEQRTANKIFLEQIKKYQVEHEKDKDTKTEKRT